MTPFKGFPDSSAQGIDIPELFFSEALPLIDSLTELKVCLQCFRVLHRQNREDAFLTAAMLLEADQTLTTENAVTALLQACEQGILLRVRYQEDDLYFLNTARARAIQKASAKGVWNPTSPAAPVLQTQRPNIYQLYEENIGPLTPILSQVLEDAENSYPAEWLEEAVKIAVKKNVRSWNYVEAILRSWKEKGRNETDRRDNQENPRNYIEGDLADYIKH